MPKFKLQAYGPTLYCEAETIDEAEEIFNSMLETGNIDLECSWGDAEQDDTIPDEWV